MYQDFHPLVVDHLWIRLPFHLRRSAYVLGQEHGQIATDGNVDQNMIVFMMTLSFFIPAIGVLLLMSKIKIFKVVNAVLAALTALFNIAHAFMELPSDNAGQYVILPMMIVVGIVLAWNSIKYVKED